MAKQLTGVRDWFTELCLGQFPGRLFAVPHVQQSFPKHNQNELLSINAQHRPGTINQQFSPAYPVNLKSHAELIIAFTLIWIHLSSDPVLPLKLFTISYIDKSIDKSTIPKLRLNPKLLTKLSLYRNNSNESFLTGKGSHAGIERKLKRLEEKIMKTTR